MEWTQRVGEGETLSFACGRERDASVDEGSVLNCSPISLRRRNRTPRA